MCKFLSTKGKLFNSMNNHREHLLFVVSEDWVFRSHRLHLAERALSYGYFVTVLCKINSDKRFLEEKGINTVNWKLDRGSINVFKFLKQIYHTYKIIKKLNPSIVQVVAIKPILVIGLVCFFYRPEKLIYCITGLGSLFTVASVKTVFLRPLVLLLLKNIFRFVNGKVVLQNEDDVKFVMQKFNLPHHSIEKIEGAGVDTAHYTPKKEPKGLPTIILPARVLVDKGVKEFVEMARIINLDKEIARFKLVGGFDERNPNSVYSKDLKNWVREGHIEWGGYKSDVRSELQKSHIVCFPSYKRGCLKLC